MKKENMILTFLPLILIEVYLIMSLLLFEFGAIKWNIDNKQLFWMLIFAYHFMFILGYIFSVYKIKVYKYEFKRITLFDNHFLKLIWIFLIIATIGTLISYRNLVCSQSYIPYRFFLDFYDGLLNPGERYYYKLSEEAAENFSGNYIVTMCYAAIAFVRFSLVPVLVFFWRKISVTQKIYGIILAFIYFASGVSVGTNKPLFDTLFLFSGALIIEFMVNFKTERLNTLKTRKTIIGIIILLLFFCPIYFQYSLNQRVDSAKYIEAISKDGNFFLKPGYSGEELLVWVSLYVAQGYYGMSLAIDESFTSTYGIGNSHFLISSFQKYLNIDISSRTYQHKITDQWSELTQWHSFYSQVANDVSFYGVVMLMFILGVFSALIWRDVLATNNIIGKCLLLLFIIMFLYMPANNQVMNIMETLFAFIQLFSIWLIIYSLNLYRRSVQ